MWFSLHSFLVSRTWSTDGVCVCEAVLQQKQVVVRFAAFASAWSSFFKYFSVFFSLFHSSSSSAFLLALLISSTSRRISAFFFVCSPLLVRSVPLLGVFGFVRSHRTTAFAAPARPPPAFLHLSALSFFLVSSVDFRPQESPILFASPVSRLRCPCTLSFVFGPLLPSPCPSVRFTLSFDFPRCAPVTPFS